MLKDSPVFEYSVPGDREQVTSLFADFVVFRGVSCELFSFIYILLAKYHSFNNFFGLVSSPDLSM